MVASFTLTIFADADSTPWWVAGFLGASTVVFAFLRLYDYYKRQRAKWRSSQIQVDKEQHELDKGIRQDLTTEQREARRDSETEAWKVVDRLTKEVEGHKREIDAILENHAEKIKDIEERERICAEERAAENMILRILVIWAKRQRNPPPIPDDVLAKFGEGSGSHPALPQ